MKIKCFLVSLKNRIDFEIKLCDFLGNKILYCNFLRFIRSFRVCLRGKEFILRDRV